MGESIFLIIAGVFIIAFIVSFFFTKEAIIKRKLKKASYKKISEVKDNEIVKIVGTVELIEAPLISPLSSRLCSFYYVHIEESVSSGKSSTWKTVIEEEVSSNFLIKEDKNYAFINDKNIKCYIVQDRSYSSGFMNDAKVNLKRYLKDRGVDSEGLFGFNKTLRYNEGVLEDGEEIAVFGRGNWKEAAALKLPERFSKVLAISSTQEVAVHVSDDPSTTIRKAIKESASKKYERHENHYRK